MRHIYAKMETNFLHHPTVRQLTGAQFKAYLALWLMAVEYRQETLDLSLSDPQYVANRASTRTDVVLRCISKCTQASKPLLSVDPEGRITVCGVTKLHPSLFRQRRDIQHNTTQENTREHNTTPRTTKQSVFDLTQEGKNQEPQDVKAILDRWQGYSGRPIDPKTIETVTELVLHHGENTVRHAMSEAFQRNKTNSLAYVKAICKNNEGKLKDMSSIADILGGRV